MIISAVASRESFSFVCLLKRSPGPPPLCAVRPHSLKWARRSITLTPPLICESAHAASVDKCDSGDYSTDGHNCREAGDGNARAGTHL